MLGICFWDLWSVAIQFAMLLRSNGLWYASEIYEASQWNLRCFSDLPACDPNACNLLLRSMNCGHTVWDLWTAAIRVPMLLRSKSLRSTRSWFEYLRSKWLWGLRTRMQHRWLTIICSGYIRASLFACTVLFSSRTSSFEWCFTTKLVLAHHFVLIFHFFSHIYLWLHASFSFQASFFDFFSIRLYKMRVHFLCKQHPCT